MFEVKGISKTFPGVRALDEVSMCLQPGEIHGLIGFDFNLLCECGARYQQAESERFHYSKI